MGFFSRKKENKSDESDNSEEKKDVAAAVAKKPEVSNARLRATRGQALPTDRDLSSIIIRPRVTEKAMGQGEQNVYTFVVRRDATKYDVRDAVESLFKVTPVKVNIVNKSPRQYMSKSKGRHLTEKGMKKAYVYLKQGDRIDLV